ncbi:hypothetical protein POTOM_031718 [Populus tomentosa]|uniref:Uncharacterized protein n=1 Tax=Populus tomentosa TaxID=118781 RepID=A0A8X8CIN2_POPTO|nr:hypothetical protein POTOM_031718 [Populus tomentosa]
MLLSLLLFVVAPVHGLNLRKLDESTVPGPTGEKCSPCYCPPPPAPSKYDLYITGPPGEVYPVDKDVNAASRHAVSLQVLIGCGLIGLVLPKAIAATVPSEISSRVWITRQVPFVPVKPPPPKCHVSLLLENVKSKKTGQPSDFLSVDKSALITDVSDVVWYSSEINFGFTKLKTQSHQHP